MPTHRHELAESESPLYACPRGAMGGLDLVKSGLLNDGYKVRAFRAKMNIFGATNLRSGIHHPLPADPLDVHPIAQVDDMVGELGECRFKDGRKR